MLGAARMVWHGSARREARSLTGWGHGRSRERAGTAVVEADVAWDMRDGVEIDFGLTHRR